PDASRFQRLPEHESSIRLGRETCLDIGNQSAVRVEHPALPFLVDIEQNPAYLCLDFGMRLQFFRAHVDINSFREKRYMPALGKLIGVCPFAKAGKRMR